MAEDNKTVKTQGPAGRAVRLLKPKPKSTEAHDAPEASAESQIHAGDIAHPPRFHFFLIDCGWEGPVPNLIRNNLSMITHLQNNDPLFVLTREQSDQMLRKYPHLIGKDPVLLARDLYASRTDSESEYHGFHLNLGLIKTESEALATIRTFLNFLASHRKGGNIEKHIQEQLHRDGIKGAIEVLRVGSEAIVGG
jgi:hypothetical protein